MTSSKLGTDTQTGETVYLHKASRLRGLYIIGAPGTGKSGLIENLIIQDIEQDIGVCLLDPHGDLTSAVLSRLPDRRVKDVIILDIANYHYPFGLNLFACSDITNPLEVQKIVDKVRHIFEKLLGVSTDTPLILEYLLNCTYTLIANPGYTMSDIPLLLTDEACRRKLVAHVTDPDVRLFWRQYELMKPNEQSEQTASIRRRIGEFLQSLSRPIVGQAQSTIDMRSVMDERKILLVKLSAELPSVTSLIGSVIITLFLNAAYSRAELPVEKRKQFNLYADEFQRFATEDFAILFTEARKFGIALTVAHQTRDQLDLQNRSTTLNVSNIVIFKISGKDAEELSGEFDTTPPPPEMIGQKPIFSPKRDVVDHLVKNGHKNPAVNSFASTYLVGLDDVLKRYATKEKIDWMDHTSFFEESFLAVDDLREGIHELNNTLYACMVDHDAYKPISPYTLLAASFCFKFTQGIGLGMGLLLGKGYNVELKHRFKPRQITLAFCQPNVFSHLEDLRSQVSKQDNFNQAIAFLRSLRSAMEALAIDPILVDTGQHEPIFDKPRQYADVQNEIATRLANLPKFTAQVKIVGADGNPVEHTVKTLAPERGLKGIALQERIERIQAHNKQDGYVKERAKVEEELRRRQDQNYQSAQQLAQLQTPQGARRKLVLICPKCKAQYRQGAQFCNQCGEKV